MSERARILLVDDRPENLLALEAVLEPLGHELVRAQSGEEALRHLLHGEFALILLDVQMPGLDGFATAGLIKARERTRHVPIIFLTAISKDAEHIFRGYDTGAVDYLLKPLDTAVLLAKVKVFVDLWQKTAEVRRQAELLLEQARALESVADAVLVVDRRGIVRLWNTAAAAMTGLAAADVVGRPITESVPGWSELAQIVPVATSATARLQPVTAPLEIGGRELWLSGSGVALEDGTVYAFRDVSKERALEKIRSDFVATVSHELRTPLAAIYGSAQTLRRPDLQLDERTRDELVSIVASESDRLTAIVDDLLLSSHLDSGRLPLTIESCDARELAARVLDSARTHVPAGVELELEASDELPPVAADAAQLHQVLANLVDNAVKYSPGGGKVSVKVQNGGGSLRFAVSDHGLGIPRGEVRRIFEKFYRLDPDMMRGIGGTGLGLYICRELVRRMEGRIWVDSHLGRGSTFVVELPAVQAKPA